MKIFSQRFNMELDFPDDKVLSLPNGLPGFPDSKKFCILEMDSDSSPFKWLHDIEDTSIALLITDPYQFFPSYNPEIPIRVVEELSVTNVEEELMLFTIVMISGGGREAYTNLRAPVVVNVTSRTAKQVILESDEYAIKTALFYEQKNVAAV